MIIIYVQLLSRFNVSIAYHQWPPPQPHPRPSPTITAQYLSLSPAFPAITLSPGRFPSLFPHVSLLSLSLSCARHRSFPLRLRVSSLTCYSGGCGVDGGGGGSGGGSFPSSLRSLFSSLVLVAFLSLSLHLFRVSFFFYFLFGFSFFFLFDSVHMHIVHSFTLPLLPPPCQSSPILPASPFSLFPSAAPPPARPSGQNHQLTFYCSRLLRGKTPWPSRQDRGTFSPSPLSPPLPPYSFFPSPLPPLPSFPSPLSRNCNP